RRARVAGRDGELAGTLDRVGQHIRPPPHADARYAYRVTRHRPSTPTLRSPVGWAKARSAVPTLKSAVGTPPDGGFAHPTKLGVPPRADRLDRRARNLFIRRPVAAGHADATDAFTIHDHRCAAFHRGPALRAGREREPERMRHIER